MIVLGHLCLPYIITIIEVFRCDSPTALFKGLFIYGSHYHILISRLNCTDTAVSEVFYIYSFIVTCKVSVYILIRARQGKARQEAVVKDKRDNLSKVLCEVSRTLLQPVFTSIVKICSTLKMTISYLLII